MSNRALEALGRIPPSPTLAQTLARASDYARHQSHRRITLEHVLLALCDDPDAGRALTATRVDIRQIMIDASSYVGRIEDRAPPHQPVEPVLDSELSRLLEYATVAAQQSGRREINGAILLAAIVGEERSAAATILKSQGLTFAEAIASLRATTSPAPDSIPESQPAATKPGGYASSEEILASVRDRIQAGRPAELRAAPMRPAEPAPVVLAPVVQPPPAPAPTYAPPYGQPQPYEPPFVIPAANQPGWTEQPAPQLPQSLPQPPPIRIQPPERRERTQPPTEARRQATRSTEASEALLPLREVDPVALAAMLPGRLTKGLTETIEVRIARADVARLGASLSSEGPSTRSDLIVSRSLTVRLKCPDGGIAVEPVSTETQWIAAEGSGLADDAMAWRWMLTGRRSGAASLQLSVRARTVGIDGTPIESALPDQSHPVRVGPHWLRLGALMGGLLAAFLLGLVAAFSAGLLIEFVLGISTRGPG